MEDGQEEFDDAFRCVNAAVSGLLGLADWMGRAGECRTSDAIRFFALEVDDAMGRLRTGMTRH